MTLEELYSQFFFSGNILRLDSYHKKNLFIVVKNLNYDYFT